MAASRKHSRWYILMALLAAAVVIWYAVLKEDRGGRLTVAFLDVGQGDAIYIESPTGAQMMIDGGPDGKVLRELGGELPFYDRSIDLLLISNPDKDHIAGFIDVLKRFKVENVILPGTFNDSAAYAALKETVRLEGAKQITATRGMEADLGGGARLTVLFPDRDVGGLEPNTGSIVAKLTYGETCFLFPGDAPAAVEEYLASLDRELLRCQVLKVGHHGSRTSTSESFLGRISPAYAVISDGKENKYGHPHQEVLERLRSFDAEVLRTDQLGTVLFYSDGEDIFVAR